MVLVGEKTIAGVLTVGLLALVLMAEERGWVYEEERRGGTGRYWGIAKK